MKVSFVVCCFASVVGVEPNDIMQSLHNALAESNYSFDSAISETRSSLAQFEARTAALWIEYSDITDQLFLLEKREDQARDKRIERIQWLSDMFPRGDLVTPQQPLPESLKPLVDRMLDILVPLTGEGSDRDIVPSTFDIELMYTQFTHPELTARPVLDVFIHESVSAFIDRQEDAFEVAMDMAGVKERLSEVDTRLETNEQDKGNAEDLLDRLETSRKHLVRDYSIFL
jgi:hypothetical protein